jgi:hypothetical protein
MSSVGVLDAPSTSWIYYFCIHLIALTKKIKLQAFLRTITFSIDYEFRIVTKRCVTLIPLDSIILFNGSEVENRKIGPQ